MAKQVVGLFSSMQDAREAVQELRNLGFDNDDISIVASNRDGGTSNYDADSGTQAAEGAVTGATGGAVLGGLGGVLAGLGAFLIPGIGPVVGAGTLATALGMGAAGAGIGAASGGLLGALVGAGIPDEDANVYAEGVRRGGALVTVQADSDDMANRAADIMDAHNVQDIDNLGQNYRSGGWTRFDESSGEYGGAGMGSGAGTGMGGYSDTGDTSDSGSGIGTGVGTLSGAATGAAVGSVGGPVGTVIGGIAGAVTGAGVGAAGDRIGAAATDDDSGYATSTGGSGSTGMTGGMGSSGMTTEGYTGDSTRMGSAIDTDTTTGTSYAGTTTGSTGMSGTTDYSTTGNQGEVAIPIVEEEIRVGKREVESGGVRVETRVTETPVNEQVTLRDEQVTVERRAVDRAVDPSQIDQLREGTFEVRERDEQAVVAKEARVVEEVVINKEVQQHTETIQDTVRRTDVDVQQIQGETRTSGYTTTGSSGTMGTTGGTMGTTGGMSSGGQNEGVIESNASRLGNAIEGGTGLDIDRDGDVGQRDPRNNI